MKAFFKIIFLFMAIFSTQVHAQAKLEEIIMVRHGEKPANGLGQLSCQGLNRSLALPQSLISQFGIPDYIFAPNPSELKEDKGTPYDYIRPLATIEPTAISLEMPVNTNIGFKNIAELENQLLQPQYEDKKIFIAWEHYYIQQLSKHLVGVNNQTTIPEWQSDDFDSIYVILIYTKDHQKTITFLKRQENLNNMSTKCPW